MLKYIGYDKLIVKIFVGYDKLPYLCTIKNQLTPKSWKGNIVMKNLEIKNGYYMELAIGGHYRLMRKDENGNEVFVAEDPACEDMYDDDSARSIWESRIDEGEFNTPATNSTTSITTLNEFADYINSKEDWELGFDKIIEANGWVNLMDDDNDICSCGSQVLTMTENGAVVVTR